MTTPIQTYNANKYQNVLIEPLIDTVQGDSTRMVISSDGRDTDASGNTTGALTLNVSGGVWTDYNSVTTKQFGVSGSLTAATAQTVFQFDSNTYNSCFIELLYGRGGSRWAERVILVIDGSGPTFERTSTGNPPHNWSATTSSGTTDVKLTGQTADTYKLVVKLL